MAEKREIPKIVRRWVVPALVILLLVTTVLLVGVRYNRFVAQTVYQESVSHLGEMLRQSTTILNELIHKNNTYLHMWGRHLARTTDEEGIRDYIEEAQEEVGFSQFFFLSSGGYYMTPEGETGFLGLQGNLEDQVSQGGDIVMNAVLPGKPQMLVTSKDIPFLPLSTFPSCTSSFSSSGGENGTHRPDSVCSTWIQGQRDSLYQLLPILPFP